MTKILTGNYHLVKSLNSQIVLDLIRTQGPIYGADLAKITGMRPSTIMNILKNLERKGLIVKAGTGKSTIQGGRKPTLWEICGNYGYIIGIKIELNEIEGVLMDLNSKILARAALKSERMQDISMVEEKIINIIDQLVIPQKISRKNVLGLGIGVSGAVDYVNGVIVRTDLIKENPVPLREILEKHFDFPIFVENDANAAALCEKWFGKGKGVSHLLFTLLVIDQDVFGIGYGLILDDHIYRGAHMFAGETSRHNITIKNILDRITNTEEIEIQIAGKTINKNEVNIHLLIEAALERDPIAMKYFNEVGRILGEELVKIVDLLDPQMIVLGGEITKVGDLLLTPIQTTIEQGSCLGIKRDLKIEVAAPLSDNSVALGAASLILQDIFGSPVIKSKNYLT